MDITLLTASDVMAKLLISRATLTRWRRAGIGPRGFMMGGRLRYRASEVEAYLVAQEAAEEQRAAGY